MIWKQVIDRNHYWKPHLVPAGMAESLLADLNERAAHQGPVTYDEVTVEAPDLFVEDVPDGERDFFIDQPGMVLADRHIRNVDLGGIRVCVPSQDWSVFLCEFSKLKRRTWADGREYYKIHAGYWCLVLTPDQLFELITGMEDQEKAAEIEGQEDDRHLVESIGKLSHVKCARVEAIKSAEANKAAGEEPN